MAISAPLGAGKLRKVSVNVSFEPGLLEELDAAVARVGKTRSEFIRDLVAMHLQEAEYEALVDEGLALAVEEALADPANHEGVPLEEFLRERGL